MTHKELEKLKKWLCEDGLFRYDGGMLNTLPTPAKMDADAHGIPDSKRCFPRCSESQMGERYGVILAVAQRHESGCSALKRPPSGGRMATREVDASPNNTKRYGIQSSRIAANCHHSHRTVPTCRKHPRQGSNLQPSAPEAEVLSPTVTKRHEMSRIAAKRHEFASKKCQSREGRGWSPKFIPRLICSIYKNTDYVRKCFAYKYIDMSHTQVVGP